MLKIISLAAAALLLAAPLAAAGDILSQSGESGGADAYPVFSGRAVPVTAGGVLASSGGDAGLQSANSLPSGFQNDVPDYGQAAASDRYVQREQDRMLAAAMQVVVAMRAAGHAS